VKFANLGKYARIQDVTIVKKNLDKSYLNCPAFFADFLIGFFFWIGKKNIIWMWWGPYSDPWDRGERPATV
jgi:hypothetical protein